MVNLPTLATSMRETDEALKARIVAHCAYMAKHDRAYAIWAFKRYCEALHWINWKIEK
jgi:hypothetical protein